MWFLFVIIFIPNLNAISNKSYCANDTDIIDHILYDTTVNYNRHKIPSDPVTVRIEMWIQEVTSVCFKYLIRIIKF